MVNERTASRVKAIMAQVLDLDLSPEQIDDALPLYSSSIRLDSLGFLHLVIALEAEFGCQLEDEDVMQANLETVGNLIQLVQDKLVTKEPVLEEHSPSQVAPAQLRGRHG
jgi:acyl carrier protein